MRVKRALVLVSLVFIAGVSALVYAQISSPAVPVKKTESPTTNGWKTDLSKHSIDLDEIQSGGPPKDGIPSIDSPKFVPIGDAGEWLDDKEPVILLVVDGKARVYPLQILIWHEIVNDRFNGLPVAVTFCPLCYSAIVFDRNIKGETHSFGVTGMLRHSDMIMYDRETESWWQQFNGEAVAGKFTGAKLDRLPAQIVSFGEIHESFPDANVLSRETGYTRDYGRNPYVGYDDVSQRPFLFKGKSDGRLRPMEKVIAVEIGKKSVAYPYSISRERHVIHDVVGKQRIVVFHADGAASALDNKRISESKIAGTTGVFIPVARGRELNFDFKDNAFVDRETGSIWNTLGKATDGDLKGETLERVIHGDYFAFAWIVFKPDSRIYKNK